MANRACRTPNALFTSFRTNFYNSSQRRPMKDRSYLQDSILQLLPLTKYSTGGAVPKVSLLKSGDQCKTLVSFKEPGSTKKK
jgi:hypothetical protein